MAKSKDAVTESNKVDWSHKRPIAKVEKKDVEAYAKDKSKVTSLIICISIDRHKRLLL